MHYIHKADARVLFFGALLAVVEPLQTFGRWMGSHWLNRFVGRLIVFNVLAACRFCVFLRLRQESGMMLFFCHTDWRNIPSFYPARAGTAKKGNPG